MPVISGERVHVRPGEEGGDRGCREGPEQAGGLACALDELVCGPECKEERALKGEEQEEGHPAEQRLWLEQVKEAADVVAGGPDRHSVQNVCESDSPEECGQGTSKEEGTVPPAPPGQAFSLLRNSKAAARQIRATRISSRAR